MLFCGLIFSLSCISCKKSITGCTDSTADNFLAEATSDDGSCSYHGNLVSWYTNTTRDSLLANNVASVSVHVDNEVIQNFYTNVSVWSTEPNCSTSGLGNWISMTNTKIRTIVVSVKALDNANVEIRSWNQTYSMQANECQLHEIIWD